MDRCMAFSRLDPSSPLLARCGSSPIGFGKALTLFEIFDPAQVVALLYAR
jgi:hypothetical protein